MHNKNAGLRMQNYFPEGFVFQNALYGLTWCDLINQDTDSSIRNEAILEIDWAIDELLSENGTYIFQEELPLKYGVFYRGWTNYLIGRRLLLDKKSQRLLDIYETNRKDISQAFNTSESPYLESYNKACWPADNVIAISSLALEYDINISTSGPLKFYDTWFSKVQDRLDTFGRIPHAVDWKSGECIQDSRGNSMSLMLCFLQDINHNFVKEQFQSYKKNFLDYRLGLPGIREYPKGVVGQGDVDSGPVIWDIGGAASIVGQRTMAINREWNTYEGLRNSIEAFGAAYTWQGQKKYVFGQMPMADAFIAWGKAGHKPSEFHTSLNWRWKFQLGSLLISFLCFFCMKKLK